MNILIIGPLLLPSSGEASAVSGSEGPASLYGTPKLQGFHNQDGQVSPTTFGLQSTLPEEFPKLRRVKDPSRHIPKQLLEIDDQLACE